MNIKRKVSSIIGGATLFALTPVVAFAATNIVVTPTNTQGWSTADTRTNGSVTYVADANAPLGDAVLRLQTGAATGSPLQDKAQYLHDTNTALTAVTALGYSTKQVAASFPDGDPSYQVVVNLNGAAGGFTTLVYEPYQNGTVTPGAWQSWDVDQGQFWSSKTVTCSNGGVLAGGGGTYFYTLSQLKTSCPDAVVTGFGVNVGSNNPNWDTYTDAVQFNDTTYDFELVAPKPVKATNKDDCKDGGWKNFQTQYKNQGDCVSSVVSNKDKAAQPSVAESVRSFFGL